jgi:hypothetical protein
MNPDTTSIAGYSKTVGADAEVFLDAQQRPVAVSEEHPLPVKIVAGLELEFKNDLGNPLPVTGPLTDAQLRATPLPVSTSFTIPPHNDVEIAYSLTAFPSKPTYMTFRLNGTAVFWLMFTYDAAGNLTRIQPD